MPNASCTEPRAAQRLTAPNYHHLRPFHRIAHEGSLTRAAEALNLSQSALSVQLQKLEQQLGHDLFERRGKKLILTEAGRIAHDYADTVVETGSELIKVLQGRRRTTQHVLRVGALTTLSRNLQLEFLRPLIGRPDVELVLRSGTMHELLTQLEMHRLDVALATSAVRRDAATDLHSYLIAEQPVGMVGRPRPNGAPLRFPDALRTVPIMLPSLDSEIRVALDRALSLAGIHPIIQAEVDDMAMLRLLAREGEGVAVVPPIVVQDELQAGLLIEHCRIPDVTERFYAIIQTRRFPTRSLASWSP